MTISENGEIERLRGIILYASLPHIGFDGWTDTALNQGAADVGEPAVAVRRAFPGGARQAFEWFSRDCDARTVAALHAEDVSAMRVRDRIATAVRFRLQLLTPYREAMRRAATFLALPHNSPLALKCLYRTVDDIWHAAGDTSTDHNFYTKRLLLAGVISSTTLYWLDDSSEDQNRTWAFLDRRIADVMKVPGTIGRVTTAVRKFAPRPGTGFQRRPFARR